MAAVAAKLSKTVGKFTPLLLKPYKSHPKLFSSTTTTNHEAINPVAVQMINYALSLARSQKTDESYGQGLLVLEQCESNQQDDNSKGSVLLAMSTLLSERENFNEAIEKLQKIKDLSHSSMSIRVAATEALGGLYLELGQEDSSSLVAETCIYLLDDVKIDLGHDFGILDVRAKALKGLVELCRDNIESSKPYFARLQNSIDGVGNAALSYAEVLHAMNNFSKAKEWYQKTIQEIPENKDFSDPYNITAGCMAWEHASLAATCALGQLEAHMGNFSVAEEILTQALKKAEDHFGFHHPKVGVVLTCIALMFRQKATVERSSSFLIQEGLYRRAIELLKAPPLATEVAGSTLYGRDIVALARGGYGELLCLQQNRRGEGERLKSWAETAWRNRRLSLAEALDRSEPSSKVPVIDARISRVL